jgi:hypothetical protein
MRGIRAGLGPGGAHVSPPLFGDRQLSPGAIAPIPPSLAVLAKRSTFSGKLAQNRLDVNLR